LFYSHPGTALSVVGRLHKRGEKKKGNPLPERPPSRKRRMICMVAPQMQMNQVSIIHTSIGAGTINLK
jgi:hypothetical protein